MITPLLPPAGLGPITSVYSDMYLETNVALRDLDGFKVGHVY